MSLIPPPPDPSIHEEDLLSSSQTTLKGIGKLKDNQSTATKPTNDNEGGFLNMQAVDVRKWNWGDVLTLGLRPPKTSPAGSTALSSRSSPRASLDQQEDRSTGNESSGGTTKAGTRETSDKVGGGDSETNNGCSILEAQVDQGALDDAMSTESIGEDGTVETPSIPSTESEEIEEDEEKKTIREHDLRTPKPPPTFLKKTVYLGDRDDNHHPLATKQRKVYFLLVCAPLSF